MNLHTSRTLEARREALTRTFRHEFSWKGKTGIFNTETNMVIHCTNNEHQAESLWDKYEGGALVWF